MRIWTKGSLDESSRYSCPANECTERTRPASVIAGRDDRAAHPLVRLLEQKRNVLSARFLDAQLHVAG
jgi:hypothetical protein